MLCFSRKSSASSTEPLEVTSSSSCPILDSINLTSSAVFRIPVFSQTQSDSESSGSAGSMGWPESSMVEKFDPNSVVSTQRGQVHQKFLVMWRWSRRAMVPHSAWEYMVEICSPSAISRPARTVICTASTLTS